jgi:hypothetical protein
MPAEMFSASCRLHMQLSVPGSTVAIACDSQSVEFRDPHSAHEYGDELNLYDLSRSFRVVSLERMQLG